MQSNKITVSELLWSPQLQILCKPYQSPLLLPESWPGANYVSGRLQNPLPSYPQSFYWNLMIRKKGITETERKPVRSEIWITWSFEISNEVPHDCPYIVIYRPFEPRLTRSTRSDNRLDMSCHDPRVLWYIHSGCYFRQAKIWAESSIRISNQRIPKIQTILPHIAVSPPNFHIFF